MKKKIILLENLKSKLAFFLIHKYSCYKFYVLNTLLAKPEGFYHNQDVLSEPDGFYQNQEVFNFTKARRFYILPEAGFFTKTRRLLLLEPV